MEKGIKAKKAQSKICREAILCSLDRDLQIAIDEWRLRVFKTKNYWLLRFIEENWVAEKLSFSLWKYEKWWKEKKNKIN